jgi:hypothetical protein
MGNRWLTAAFYGNRAVYRLLLISAPRCARIFHQLSRESVRARISLTKNAPLKSKLVQVAHHAQAIYGIKISRNSQVLN